MMCTYGLYYQLTNSTKSKVYNFNYFEIKEQYFLKNYKKILSLFTDTIFLPQKYSHLNVTTFDKKNGVVYIDSNNVSSWNKSPVIMDFNFVFASPEYIPTFPTIINII